jgi:hypothetical protein
MLLELEEQAATLARGEVGGVHTTDDNDQRASVCEAERNIRYGSGSDAAAGRSSSCFMWGAGAGD